MTKVNKIRRWSNGRVKRYVKKQVRVALMSTVTEFDKSALKKGKNASALAEHSPASVEELINDIVTTLLTSAVDDLRNQDSGQISVPSIDEVIELAKAHANSA